MSNLPIKSAGNVLAKAARAIQAGESFGETFASSVVKAGNALNNRAVDRLVELGERIEAGHHTHNPLKRIASFGSRLQAQGHLFGGLFTGGPAKYKAMQDLLAQGKETLR